MKKARRKVTTPQSPAEILTFVSVSTDVKTCINRSLIESNLEMSKSDIPDTCFVATIVTGEVRELLTIIDVENVAKRSAKRSFTIR